MSKAPINIKELTLISTGSSDYLYDEKAEQIIVFPTAKEFLDAVVENGQAKEAYAQDMKALAMDLKDAINILGSKEKVVKYIRDDMDDITEEQLDELTDLSCTLHLFADYCMTSGIHYEEITKYIIDGVITGYPIDPKDIELGFYNILSPDAPDTYYSMTIEYGLGYEVVLYKLSAEEQEMLKKQMEELDGKISQNELYIKAFSLVIDEIIELFAE